MIRAVILLVFFALPLAAQTARVEGVVYYSPNGDPALAGFTTMTDESGKFVCSDSFYRRDCVGSREATLSRKPCFVRSYPFMEALLRFPEAVRHEPAIDTWLRNRPDELRPIAQEWFAFMRDCGDDVTELMHDGCPTVCVEDAAFAYVCVWRAHINVGFFCGAFLKDPAGLLEGIGKRMRHVKLRPGADIDSPALKKLIRDAYVDIKARLAK